MAVAGSSPAAETYNKVYAHSCNEIVGLLFTGVQTPVGNNIFCAAKAAPVNYL